MAVDLDKLYVEKMMEEKARVLEPAILRYLPNEIEGGGFDRKVREAMRYSVQAGGKRLRPILLMECFHAFGGKGTIYEPFCAAIEYLHTYSLIHDDLPAMDDDDLRRGQPSCHAKFGEAAAILAGDGLLNLAFEVMAGTVANVAVARPDTGEPGEYLKKMACITAAANHMGYCSGIRGMVGGQAADVVSEAEGTEVSKELLEFIYIEKTAAMFSGAMGTGMILAGAPPKLLPKVTEAAKYIGVAFQLRDDILDIEGDESELGKPVHSDEKNKKRTYAAVYGVEQAVKDCRYYTGMAIASLRSCGVPCEFLQDLFVYLAERNR